MTVHYTLDDPVDDEIPDDEQEPPTCYYTGGGPCGDCRNPETNQPLRCFG